MAPKAQLARKAATTKETKSNAAALKKKPRAAAKCTKTGNRRITARDWQSVVAGLKGSEELPKKVQKMFANLLGQSLLESEHPYEEQAVAEVGEAIAEIEARLSKAVEEAKAIVDDADQQARQEALRQAEGYIEEQKQSIAESKLAIKDSSKAVHTAKEELKSAHAARKSVESEQKKIGAQITRLEAAEKETFQPLKEMSAGNPKGVKMVKTPSMMCKKDFAFHDVLMNVLPVVLKKQPDRRRTFDDLTMQQFEAECSKHVAAMESTRAETQTAISSSSEAVQAAQAALDAAEAQHASSTNALSKSEENLLQGKKMLLAARQRVRRFDSDTRKAARDLEQAGLQLSSFQEGAAAAFRELRMRPLAIAPVEVPACSAAVLEADHTVTAKAKQKDGVASLESEEEGKELEKKETETGEEKETKQGEEEEDNEKEAEEGQDEEDGEEEEEEDEEEEEEEEDNKKEVEEGRDEEDGEEEAEEGEKEEDEKEEEKADKANIDQLEDGGEETEKEQEAEEETEAKGEAAVTEEPSTKRARTLDNLCDSR